MNSLIFLRFSSIVWCNLNWLLMDVTSLKVPLVLLSSSLHPNHQSREEQRAKKRSSCSTLKKQNFRTSASIFFFLLERRLELLLQRRHRAPKNFTKCPDRIKAHYAKSQIFDQKVNFRKILIFKKYLNFCAKIWKLQF